jgi:hypothetical protein
MTVTARFTKMVGTEASFESMEFDSERQANLWYALAREFKTFVVTDFYLDHHTPLSKGGQHGC